MLSYKTILSYNVFIFSIIFALDRFFMQVEIVVLEIIDSIDSSCILNRSLGIAIYSPV